MTWDQDVRRGDEIRYTKQEQPHKQGRGHDFVDLGESQRPIILPEYEKESS